MQLGLDLALANVAPLFCGEAQVTGRLPREDKIAYGQRTRWEHGHLRTIATQAPRLFKAGIVHRNLQAIAMAMELSVPPLALLTLALLTLGGGAAVAGWLGAGWLAAKLLLGGIAAVAICLLCAWARFGRGVVPVSALLAAPIYIAWKIPMYLAFLFRRQTEWNRTARDNIPTGIVVPAESGPPAVGKDLKVPATSERLSVEGNRVDSAILIK
jgi:hypothetical protein